MKERGNRNHPVVMGALRWSIVIIFAFFGIAKFAAYEAQGVAGIANKHPLFAWMYPIWGDGGASAIIGCIELLTGALIAAGAFHARAGLVDQPPLDRWSNPLRHGPDRPVRHGG